MIQEKEIRIGNYFHYDPIQWNYAGHQGTFKWSSSDWSALGDATLFLEDIEPIPLTEEWLLKFGFKKWNTDSCFTIEKGQLDIILFKTDTPVAISNGLKPNCFYYFFNKVVITIEYVHQIQNLFLSVTGDELTIKNYEL